MTEQQTLWPIPEHRVDLSTPCIEWTGTTTKNGYGFKHAGRASGTTTAHRIAWHKLYGSIDPELQIDHRCRNRKCVNPLHMELVPQSKNLRRAALHNEWKRRTKNDPT